MGLSSSKQDAVDKFVTACCNGDLDLCKAYLQTDPHCVNAHSSTGELGLVAALQKGNWDCANLILEDRNKNLRIDSCTLQNPNEKSGPGEGASSGGVNVLMAAIAGGSGQKDGIAHSYLELIIKLILKHPNSSLLFKQQDNENKWGCLHYCAYYNAPMCARLIISAEQAGDLSILVYSAALRDLWKQLPLHIACSQAFPAMVEILLQNCHDCSDADSIQNEGKGKIEHFNQEVRREPKPHVGFVDRDNCTALQLTGGTSEGDDEFRVQAVKDVFIKYCNMTTATEI